MKQLLIFLLLAIVAQIHNPSPNVAGIVGSPTKGGQVVGNGKNFVPHTRPSVDVRDFGAVGDARIAIDSGASGANAGLGGYSDCWMTSGSAILSCANSHFTAGDVGKVIAVYGAGYPGAGHIQPLASTIQSFQSGTRITLADNASNSNTQGLCSITTATWDTTGTLTATCASAANFYPNQEIIIDWSDNPAIDKHVFIVQTNSGTGFTASGSGIPDGTYTFGTRINGNPVIASGRSRRVVWGTDNTATIQAAVDFKAMISNDDQTGAIIYFPPGHYLTNGIIAACSYIGYQSCTKHYNNFWFQGSGRDTTTLENWNPNVCSSGESATANCAVFFLGYNGATHDGAGSYYYHRLQSPKISGFSLIQVANPTGGAVKVIYLYTSENADIFDNFITGPSYECIYGAGDERGYNDKAHDNHLRGCGTGGPSTSLGSSAINLNGDFVYVYNNRVEQMGICFETGPRNATFEGNFCANPARMGTGVSVGSDANGVWNVAIRSNTFDNMYQACAIQNTSGGNGSLNRVNITHNTFINSPNCSLRDGADTNYPGFETDVLIHYLSTFSHNTMLFPTWYGADTVYGPNIQSLHETWVVDGNTIIMPPTTAGQYNIGIHVQSGAVTWAPSTSYSGDDAVQRVRPRPDNDFFIARGNCTSGTSEPAWVTTTPFVSITTDNTCTWTYQGKLPLHQLSNNRIVGQGTGGDNGFCAEITLDDNAERVQMENNSISYQGGCLYVRNNLRPVPSDGNGRFSSPSLPRIRPSATGQGFRPATLAHGRIQLRF